MYLFELWFITTITISYCTEPPSCWLLLNMTQKDKTRFTFSFYWQYLSSFSQRRLARFNIATSATVHLSTAQFVPVMKFHPGFVSFRAFKTISWNWNCLYIEQQSSKKLLSGKCKLEHYDDTFPRNLRKRLLAPNRAMLKLQVLCNLTCLLFGDFCEDLLSCRNDRTMPNQNLKAGRWNLKLYTDILSWHSFS